MLVKVNSPQTNIVDAAIEKITVSTSSSSFTLFEDGNTSGHGALSKLAVRESSFSLQFINTVFVVFPGQHDKYPIINNNNNNVIIIEL